MRLARRRALARPGDPLASLQATTWVNADPLASLQETTWVDADPLAE